ncbi:MAG: hypothetical protein K0R00_18 [Herbinix sp.]|jgi:uncharacterized protein YeaO (DUF488 family)|nr:hypothetical protein [Herbinix sp.]
MVYTTYFGRLKKIPVLSRKIIVARYVPPQFNLKAAANTYHYPQLSPSTSLLKSYKDGLCDWDTFAEEYRQEMENRPDLIKCIDAMAKYIKEHGDEDIFLVCYEKDPNSCHRYLLALHLKEKYQIDCEEWRDGSI